MRTTPLLGLGCLALGVGLALLSIPRQLGSPPLARARTVDGVNFREVPMPLAHLGTAYLVQVRIETGGQVGMRLVDAPRSEPVGMVLGSWRYTGDADADRSVLRGVREALARFLQMRRDDDGLAGVRLREPTDPAPVRVLIDAAPEVPWVRSAWIVQAASHHTLMIARFTFLAQREGTWCHLDLPRDIDRGWPPPGASVQARRLVVRLFRKGMDGPPERRFTRSRSSLESLETWVDPDGFPRPEELEEPEAPPPEPPMTVLDLPPSPFVPPNHPSAWAALERLFAERGPEPRRFAEIHTPRPIGTLVPTSDVVEVMLRLQRAGYAPILLDNPAPPGADPEVEPDRDTLGR